MNEQDLMKAIREDLGHKGFCVFRANVGKIKIIEHDKTRYFDTGLPKGFSDLFAIKDGKIYFIETKVYPNKPTVEQNNFLSTMKRFYGCEGGVAYSVTEARRICGI